MSAPAAVPANVPTRAPRAPPTRAPPRAPRAPPTRVPRATLRLQFSPAFTFDMAAGWADYIADLGVSHVYASPLVKARAGSAHGYDITDHSRLNPEFGEMAAFERMADALARRGVGLILDFVPNHMGVGGSDNPWWQDVLEWGPSSPFAPFFDIDWYPREPALHGKVLLPFLGDHYGAVLERGELALRFDAQRGSFAVWYHTHRFPIAPRDYPVLLKAARGSLAFESGEFDALIAAFAQLGGPARSLQRQAAAHREAEELRARLATLAADAGMLAAIEAGVATLNGTPGDAGSFVELHHLLESQHHRVAYWRVAADEINYRRFFDINDLAGIRIERPEPFELAHQMVFRLIGEGRVQGLRLDHVDGLFDPLLYFSRLQDRAAYLTVNAAPSPDEVPGLRPRQPFWVVVEKILAHHERLAEDWPVAGTTGYDFMAEVGGLFVDTSAEAAMTAVYHRFIRRDVDYERLVIETKRRTMLTSLASELAVLSGAIHRLAQESWRTRDFTATGIRRALVDVAACLPVYRTYVTGDGVGDGDRKYLDWAIGRARTLAEAADSSLLDFLYGVLTTDLAREPRGYRPAEVIRIAMTFQQFTGPVAAKAIEDTVFYRYLRLICLNEVGGDPGRFGTSPAAFHRQARERLKRFPLGLLATATHDHKRGEDARARIAVLSEMADAWEARALRWHRLNRFKKRGIDGVQAPGRDDEYLFYQTLLGAWPSDLVEAAGEELGALAERLVAFMIKGAREAKLHTSWTAPNADYEGALEHFVRGALDPERGAVFLGEVLELLETMAPAGAVNGLAQTLLKLTAPGVPDVYQGGDYWDFSLVDPDNRRPVDFARRKASLDRLAGEGDGARLLERWRDGRVKQLVIQRTLALRKAEPLLFAAGDYQPVDAVGPRAERVVAFTRRVGGAFALVVAPRLSLALLEGAKIPLPPLSAWAGTRLRLPEPPLNGGAISAVDVLTGRARPLPAEGEVAVGPLLERLPVALIFGRAG